MNPKYPIFIPTKGRYKTPYTINALRVVNAPFKAVVEPQEYNDYRQILSDDEIIVLPHRDKGVTVTRNWIWDYVQNELKAPYYWSMDDNIRLFYRLHKNIEHRLKTPAFLRAMEDFTERYSNLYISGMQYEMFLPRKQRHNPFSLNTRIYSNMLIKTNIPFRFNTFYNEDTDLCLRILKAGFCTCLFNTFMIDKIATMKIGGGNTEYYKTTNKRLEFAKELQDAHPDVVKIVWKFDRWHHKVDYKPFKNNRLIRDESVPIKKGVNNYGMKFVEKPSDND